MALKIVTGGTTGAADGTLVSSGNPLVIVALNTAVDCHIRCDDGYWSNDQDFDVPAELEVSFDGGSTWYDNADEPITAPEIEDVNYPIKIRQTTAAASASGSFATDGTYTAIAALSTVGSFAATPSSTQVALSWGAVTNRDHYQVDRATDSGFTTGVTLGIYTGTGTSYTDTGLTNGTTYYYRIKAKGIGRYSDSASYATANAAPGAAVAGFAASVSGTTVSLSWTALAGANHYLIEWGTDGVTYGNSIDSVSGTSYSHTGRSANTIYYYRISAHDAAHAVVSSGYGTCGAGVQVLVTASSTRNIRGFNATFATARSGGGTNSVVGSDATIEGVYAQEGGGFYVDRQMDQFDTSAIPAGIDQAWLRLTATDVSQPSSGLAICKGTYSNNPPVAADFSGFSFTDLGGPTSNPSVNTPTDYAITSPASNVVAGGTTKLVVLDRAKDFGNVAPGTGAISGNTLGGKGNTTADRRPQLKVSYHF